jgi:hypothetical protein
MAILGVVWGIVYGLPKLGARRHEAPGYRPEFAGD